MEELDYDYTIHQREKEADKALAVRFFIMPLQNEHKSQQEGRPIFDDTEMVEIRARGDRTSVISRPVRDTDKVRFREAYLAFKDGNKVLESGTPLKEWPLISASRCEELKYLGFVTVEQLADASDAVCSNISTLTTLKQKAKAFLEYAKGISPMERLQEEINAERSRAEAAEAQIKDLAARLAKLEAAKEGSAVAAKPAARVAAAA
jgi:hypothetical protein